MSDGPTWQGRAVEQLGKLFLDDADARAFVLTGSLAGADGEVDEWSDLDAKVVLADQAVDRYYLSAAWLQPFGRLIGAERHAGQCTRTLRVCLEGFQRFDLVFIPASALLVLGALLGTPFKGLADYIWPAALFIAGVYLIYTFFRGRNAE